MIRITLIVTDVRVQRLQHISGTDAIAEDAEITGELTMTGTMVKVVSGIYFSPVVWYHRLWNEINGAGVGSQPLDRRLHVHRPSPEHRRHVEGGLMTFVKAHERRPPAKSAEYIATHMVLITRTEQCIAFARRHGVELVDVDDES
ncbi:hypothetical protein [Rhizobium mulingense]|uniref:hypothetical protein n=1 Tax=Rhizobium mulingense TaxID=3031128 RepID=UPI002B49F520|nr:hypothetical protein [Rhizobium sp. MJ21]MEB3043653.1 hypothetical protein [Rhizobium sp. MJ21]